MKKDKRLKKIKKLLLELYKLDAVEKVKVEDLRYLQDADKKNGVEYRWFIDFKGKFINE